MARTFYGDPDEPIDDNFLGGPNPDEPPEDGDELCDGHLVHYVWRDGRWRSG